LPLLRLLRPHQYIKNGFVLLGVVFSHQWGSATLVASGLVFFAFCAMASAVYVLNDILDVEADRQHPKKHDRPIASGAISARTAWALFTGLVVLSLTLGSSVGQWVLAFLSTYLVLNVAYSSATQARCYPGCFCDLGGVYVTDSGRHPWVGDHPITLAASLRPDGVFVSRFRQASSGVINARIFGWLQSSHNEASPGRLQSGGAGTVHRSERGLYDNKLWFVYCERKYYSDSWFKRSHLYSAVRGIRDFSLFVPITTANKYIDLV